MHTNTYATLTSALVALLCVCATAQASEHARFHSMSAERAAIEPGGTWSYSFVRAGTYTYEMATAGQTGNGAVLVHDDAPSGEGAVSITNNGFEPDRIEVRPGARVVWTNNADGDRAIAETHDSPGPALVPTASAPAESGGSAPAAGLLAGLVAVAAAVAAGRRRA